MIQRIFGPALVRPKGSVLIMGMVLVTILAMLSLTYCVRISSGFRKMETEVAVGRSLELAQATNDLNMRRIYLEFKKQGTNAHTWINATLRTTTAQAPRQYDYLYQADFDAAAPVGNWTDTTAWSTFGVGWVKCSAIILNDIPADSTTTPPTPAKITVELKSRAKVLDERTLAPLERQVRRIVQYSLNTTKVVNQSRTFDFAYFVNNFGWMWGSPIYIHGNVGSNANLSFRSGPTVNGYLYAAKNTDLAAPGTVVDGYPRSDTLAQYWARSPANPNIAPSNPAWTEDLNDNSVLDPGEDTNGNGAINFTDFPVGYPGISPTRPQVRLTGQSPLDVPYLGDLSLYKELSKNYQRPERTDIASSSGQYGGVIKQLKAPGLDPKVDSNYNIIVDQVYGDEDGENGKFSTVAGGAVTVNSMTAAQKLDTSAGNQWKNGNLALVGTPEQPLVITGPVVVTNDLVLKGTIKGQGTIYTGRNLHVVGDMTYSDPPTWSQNSPTLASSAETNRSKDMVGFGVKGSIILGQTQLYDAGGADNWGTVVNTYFRTCFTSPAAQAYQTDPTDQAIGYYDPATERFHGDYSAIEQVGGVNAKRYATGAETAGTAATTDRRYFQSSFSNEYLATIATARPANIHGIFYTNHLIGGRPGLDAGVKFLGTMVARDEGILFNNRFELTYDCRAAESDVGSHVNVFLPGNEETNTDAGMSTLLWEDVMLTNTLAAE